MKLKHKYAVIPFCLMLLPACFVKDQTKQDFRSMEWLPGSYSDTALNFHEHWTAAGDTAFRGAGYIKGENDTVFKEVLSIRKEAGEWFYIVYAKDKQVHFKMDGKPGDSLLFVNLSNEFPKRIAYYRKPEGVIFVRIDNPGEEGRQMLFNFIPEN